MKPAKEFWTDIITRTSWEKLQEISREFDFVLIGGWAAYLWTGRHKSKDIDIVVGHSALNYLKQKYELNKNTKLRKYEIKLDRFDIDIYVPFFSKLAIPESDLLREYSTPVKGIRTVTVEALLILKQAAEIERRRTPKGMKDEIDILTLLLYGDVDWNKYNAILKKYWLEKYSGELIRVVNSFNIRNISYLGLDFKGFKAFQKRIVNKIKK